MNKPKILILGGGFAGVEVASSLENILTNDDADIVLVSRDNFVLFTPMLHEIAASDLDITTIVNPIRKMIRRTQFIAADVEHIDVESKSVTIVHGFDRHTHVLTCDHLVLALGSVPNFHGRADLERYALTMKSLEDAMGLRNRMIAHLEEADTECAASSRQHLLTMIVAGGGFAGVETVAGLFDFLHVAVQSYPNLNSSMLRVVLLHSGELLLPELGPDLGRYAEKILRERGIEVHTKRRLERIDHEGVTLDDGTFISSGFVVWTAGNATSPQIAHLPIATTGGQISVSEMLEVQSHPGVWSLGDCALVPNGAEGFHPPTAQHALRQAKTVAYNVAASLRGKPQRPFKFKTIGQLAAIGRRTGVAKIFGFRFSGFLAWWMWRTIYLSKLPRWEKRIHVALDWTLALIFSKDIVQFVSFRAPGQPTPTQKTGEQKSAKVTDIR
jgi:NADH dehydrogenase